MEKTLTEKIARARQLLGYAKHAAMATVNVDGSPHNTPFLFMHDDALQHIFWGSHPASEHSKNALRTGQIFVVLYDAGARGGLYMKAVNAHVVRGAELEEVLTVRNKLRTDAGQSALPASYYSSDGPQRLWSADVTQLWVNGSRRDANGNIVQDIRTEVTAADLLE